MRTDFFLSKQALLAWLEESEEIQPLSYTAMGQRKTPSFPAVEVASLLPGLGEAPLGGPNHDICYLITPRGQPVNIETIELTAGGKRYVVDQALNSDSLVAYFGGEHRDNVLVCGYISTISKGVIAKKLMATLRKTLKKYTQRRQEHWIDEASLEKARKGWRLTSDVRISRANDPQFL